MSKSNERERESLSQLERLPVATSIDSLCLLFKDVIVAPDFSSYANSYKITKSTMAKKTKNGRKRRDVVLWCEGGEPVRGQSAVAKLGCFKFYLACINPCKPPQLSVTFSFPRWKWGHNARPVTQDDVANVIEDINAAAAELGLWADTARAQITRLDLFRDVVVERTFEDYLEVLRAVEPPRCDRFEDRDTWILRGTGPNRWAIYDKWAELVNQSENQDDEKNRSGFLGLTACRQKLQQQDGVGLVRFEWRLLGALKIRDQIGFDDFGSLSATDELLHEKFERALVRDVFRGPLPHERAVESWCDLQEMREQAPTRAHGLLVGPAKMETMLAIEIWNEWVKQFGSKRAREILKSAGSASEHRCFKEHLRQIQQSTLMACGLFWGELYSELAHAVFSSAHLEKLPRLPMPYVPPKSKAEKRKKQV